jgi:hypothetical protein
MPKNDSALAQVAGWVGRKEEDRSCIAMRAANVTTGKKGRHLPWGEHLLGLNRTMSDGGYRREKLLSNPCILVHLRPQRQTDAPTPQ